MGILRQTAKTALVGSGICVVGLTGLALAAVAARRQRVNRQTGKTVLITGGSRGLGLALAERFARSGFRVALVARDAEELARARQILLDRGAVSGLESVVLIPADLTDRAQAQAAVHQVIASFGHLDVLINNAGAIEVAPFENQPLEAFESSLAIHLYAPLSTIQAALPHMLERHAGNIVNIASVGGKVPVPHLLPYCAGKFSLVGFSEGLHAELRHKGIHVTTVNPGLMRTGSFVQAQFGGQPEKEFRWFSLSSTAPLLTISAARAASKIFHATMANKAELTITPQAILAARIHGLAPGTTQFLGNLVSRFVLPESSGSCQLVSGRTLQTSTPWSAKLQLKNNQRPQTV